MPTPKKSKGETLIDNFDEAAQALGWESDCGTTEVGVSMQAHEGTKANLVKYVTELEKKLKAARKKVRSSDLLTRIEKLSYRE